MSAKGGLRMSEIKGDPRLRGERPESALGYQQPTRAELYAEIRRLDVELEDARNQIAEMTGCIGDRS